jgi:hypothetical protein
VHGVLNSDTVTRSTAVSRNTVYVRVVRGAPMALALPADESRHQTRRGTVPHDGSSVLGCPGDGITGVDVQVNDGAARQAAPRPRRLLLWFAPLAVLLGAALGIGLYLAVGSDESPDSARPSPQSGPSPTTEDTTAISEGLASGDPVRLAEVVAVPPDQPLDPAAIEQLAALDVQIDPASFTPVTDDGQTGTADAQVTGPDGAVSPWTVTLIRNGSTWQLVISEPAQ